MQGSNRGYKNPPRPGDGTLRTDHSEPETNWYGQASEPQEEYIEDDVRSVNNVDKSMDETGGRARMSEGKPTFKSSTTGDAKHGSFDSHREHALDRDKPKPRIPRSPGRWSE